MTPLRLAVLGDSLGYAQGASRSDETPAARLAAVLDAAGFPTETRVFAVPGARSAGLAAQVTRALAWTADVAVVIVGANDVPAFVPPEAAGAPGGAGAGRAGGGRAPGPTATPGRAQPSRATAGCSRPTASTPPAPVTR